MQTELDTRNFQSLANLAHWLKGAGGTCGFAEFYEPAYALELAAKSGSAEEATQWLEDLFNLSRRIWLPKLSEAVT